MEKIDINMTKIHDAMDKGFEIINKTKEEENIEIGKRNYWELFLQDRLIKIIPEPLLPYIKLIDLHYPENIPYSQLKKEMDGNENFRGWFEVKIPGFALIAFHINMCGDIRFWIFNPAKIVKDIRTDDTNWKDLSIHENIKDYKVALALAKEAMDFHIKTVDFNRSVKIADTHAGESHPEAEVYEPLDGEGGTFEIDEGYVQLMIDKRLKHYGLI